jgi:hypothetical protein
MAELQQKYNLRPRRRNVTTAPPKKILLRRETDEAAPKAAEKQTVKTKTADTQSTKTKPTGTPVINTRKAEIPMAETKIVETKASQINKPEKKEIEIQTREVDKTTRNFSLENEINKIKIPVPLVELAKNPIYRKQIAKMINFSDNESQADVINLEDDKPNIIFGPHFEGARDTVAPFYITLTVHDHLLHNCMLDSGASHNVMPKSIVDRLGLEITRPYGDFYSFDSRKVKCVGMIKYLVVNLAQIPVKSVMMDVVADIPPKYGMLLSRSWGTKLGGSLQLDMTYATIPIFGGHFTRLYRETRLAFTLSDPLNPNNYPVYIANQDLGNCILSIDDDLNECIEEDCIEKEKT